MELCYGALQCTEIILFLTLLVLVYLHADSHMQNAYTQAEEVLQLRSRVTGEWQMWRR